MRRFIAWLRAWFVKPAPKKPEPVPLPPLSEDEIDQVFRDSRKQLQREKRAKR